MKEENLILDLLYTSGFPDNIMPRKINEDEVIVVLRLIHLWLDPKIKGQLQCEQDEAHLFNFIRTTIQVMKLFKLTNKKEDAIFSIIHAYRVKEQTAY
jgi:hypothetical protein